MSGIKILFFSDTHLGFDYPVSGKSRTLRRGFDFFRNFHHILDVAREKKVDLVIHGGDLFYRSEVPVTIIDQAYDALFHLADSQIPLVIVPGNHDRSTLPVSLFLEHPNIHIFRDPGVFYFDLKGIRLQVAGFPFVKYIGNEFTGILKELDTGISPDGPAMLCMHQAVEGATVGPVNYTFRPGPEVIRQNDLGGNYSAYLSGHIHRYQVLPVSGVPFIYPGSIERTAFAERYEDKGYMMLEINQTGLINSEFITLPTRPMHIIEIPDAGAETKGGLTDFIQSELAPIADHAALLISSPSERISRWLNQHFLREILPSSMHVQIRHRWLKDPRHS